MNEGSRAKSFEDLEVFKRAYRVSLDVHKLSLDFPRNEQFALADQVRREREKYRCEPCDRYRHGPIRERGED